MHGTAFRLKEKLGAHHYPASPAFTAISARQSFDRPMIPPPPKDPPPPQPSTSQKLGRDWPQAVRQYVQRSFAESNIVPDISRAEMEAKLKDVISNAAETNSLLTMDWSNLPLPQIMIQSERSVYSGPGFVPSAHMSSLSFQDTNDTSHHVANSKKRKSSDLEQDFARQEVVPPWRSGKGANSLADRITHADKRVRVQPSQNLSKSAVSPEARKRRFETGMNGHNQPPPPYVTRSPSPPDAPSGPVIGRSTSLEKQYFRLTAAPNPETVRPLPILRQTLELLKNKWRDDNNYAYICDQFKSLRQDLTVQHIKTDFTVHVYEIHARIALEKGDLGEYNQCQTQLRALYAQGLGGHPNEFKAYRILYFLHTCNRTGMNDVLADLTAARPRRALVAGPGQLPQVLQALLGDAEHGRISHGYVCGPRATGCSGKPL